eukprot:393338_1
MFRCSSQSQNMKQEQSVFDNQLYSNHNNISLSQQSSSDSNTNYANQNRYKNSLSAILHKTYSVSASHIAIPRQLQRFTNSNNSKKRIRRNNMYSRSQPYSNRNHPLPSQSIYSQSNNIQIHSAPVYNHNINTSIIPQTQNNNR